MWGDRDSQTVKKKDKHTLSMLNTQKNGQKGSQRQIDKKTERRERRERERYARDNKVTAVDRIGVAMRHNP